MGQTIQRHLGPVQSLLAAQWTELTASGRPAICCPKCGRASDLPLESRVLQGGEVSPIWSCPWEGCPAMMFVKLEAWGEPVLR